MVPSQHWQVLKERALNAVDKQGFEEVEETALDGLFWAHVREVLQFTKPIYSMTHFVDTYNLVIGEVYEHMDSMLGEIKDIVQENDPNLYRMIHNCVCARCNKLNVPLDALAYILMPEYYSPSWLGQPAPWGGVRIKPHTDPEVSKGYMETLDQLIPNKEECANLHLELGRYFNCTALFGSLHAMEDRDRFDALTWWEANGGMGLLPKLAKKVISQFVNISSAERCWSTYSFIRNVKRNKLNENQVESLVYVQYNLRLLSHYCDRAYEDPTYKIWDNSPEDGNLEDGTILHLEELEAELLRDDDEATTTMPPPPSSSSVSA